MVLEDLHARLQSTFRVQKKCVSCATRIISYLCVDAAVGPRLRRRVVRAAGGICCLAAAVRILDVEPRSPLRAPVSFPVVRRAVPRR